MSDSLVTLPVLAYPALRATPVATRPFPHVVIRNFVHDLERVAAGLPKLSRGGSFPTSSLRLDSAARGLVDELEGPRFREEVAAKFGLDLADAPVMTTLRGASREKDGRIHCDSTAKRVTVLLYLNPESAAWANKEGCLRLLRGPDDIEAFDVEVPPVNGTLLVFPNGPATWHGHKRFVGQRFVIQLNYMTTDAAARSEIRRHRITAMLKRLTMAA